MTEDLPLGVVAKSSIFIFFEAANVEREEKKVLMISIILPFWHFHSNLSASVNSSSLVRDLQQFIIVSIIMLHHGDVH